MVPPENFSDHPGAAWYGAWCLSEVLDILTSNPAVWKKTVFILTYDENDGYFDHVVPFGAPDPARTERGKTTGDDRRAEVTIPTQAGDLRVSLEVAESPSGPKWQVQNPFPTLDRDEVSKLGATPSLATVPSTSTYSTTPQTETKPTTSQPKPSTTTSAPESVITPPAMSEPEPTPVPVPVPVPGPLPIPELDTPIPGAL